MSELLNQTKNLKVISKLKIVSSTNFLARAKGLLGTKSLAAEAGLWIQSCNSIHTFFMNYAIDCVFVDKNLKVRAVFENVRPFRLLLPVWSASSVFEMPAYTISQKNIQVGDQLHVIH